VDIHSVTSVSGQKGTKFLAAIKLSVRGLDDLQDMLKSTELDIHRQTKTSSAILHTFREGVIKPLDRNKMVCETQGKLHGTTINFTCYVAVMFWIHTLLF